MKSGLAKAKDVNPLEDLGRATLQVVHDLKNQLNGLKLYATFLRKRLEQKERSPEEGETLAKLIAGLDRASRDMTALVRYSKPVELHRRLRADLRDLLSGAVKEATARPGTTVHLVCEIEDSPLYGDFDAPALSEALQALTEEAVNGLVREEDNVTLHAHRDDQTESAQAVIEWRGVKPAGRNPAFRSPTGSGSVYTALAARIIEAHGGRFESDANTMRAWTPQGPMARAMAE